MTQEAPQEARGVVDSSELGTAWVNSETKYKVLNECVALSKEYISQCSDSEPANVYQIQKFSALA